MVFSRAQLVDILFFRNRETFLPNKVFNFVSGSQPAATSKGRGGGGTSARRDSYQVNAKCQARRFNF
jgi:hypothetical protein